MVIVAADTQPPPSDDDTPTVKKLRVQLREALDEVKKGAE